MLPKRLTQSIGRLSLGNPNVWAQEVERAIRSVGFRRRRRRDGPGRLARDLLAGVVAVIGVPPPAEAGYFAEHTVAGLAGDLRAGRVTAVDLVEEALAGAARLDPVLNVFVTLDETGARAAARQAREELAAGADRGPLHGIPVAIKDVVDTAGLRTTMGSRHFADRVPDRDATCVRRLREAGAVVIGKTTTHEFAYGPTGDRAAGGATRNPYRAGHLAGGSSSGSAVAVASGIVPVSVGTDTGGSVRIPAALCGVVGLKPTHGVVPTDGVFPVASSFDTVGVLARTVEDCGLLWNVLAGGHRASDDGMAGLPPVRGELLRVGWIPPDTLHPTEPVVARAARAFLAANQIRVRDVVLPEAAVLNRTYQTMQGSEVYAVHADRMAAAADLYDSEVADRLRSAGQVRGWEYVRAREAREQARQAIESLFGEYDLLALPTVPIRAPRLGARSVRLAGGTVDVRAALLALTCPWSVVGLPAISVPAGMAEGLPVGLQLVAPPGGENLLLAVARLLCAGADSEMTVPVP